MISLKLNIRDVCYVSSIEWFLVTFSLFKRHAGTGREYNVTAAIDIEGVPPQMESISVLHGAFTGINVTTPDAPVIINNSTIQNNRGNFICQLLTKIVEFSLCM